MPTIVPVIVNCSELVTLAMPKSVIFTWPVVIEHDVGRLDIAMHDALLVRVIQTRRGFAQDAQHLFLAAPARSDDISASSVGPSTYSMAIYVRSPSSCMS